MKRALMLLLALPWLAGCDAAGSEPDAAAEARALIRAHGCGTCHMIPGFEGHGGVTGPPLTAMARQAYVAGVAANTLEVLTLFIVNPQAVDPRSAMPNLGVSPEEARLIATFLYETTR